MKVDILAFGAHPDDVELGCGGTLAKLVSEGKSVAIVDLTKGELGTRGTDETRKIEAENARNILGVNYRENLGMKDGFFKNDQEHQLMIIRTLRKFRPEIVLCNATSDRHPDHGKAAKLVSDSCFLAGLRKIETVLEAEKQEVWRPKQVFHYMQWNEVQPDFVVDISGFMDKKMDACMAYTTQFYDPNSNEPITPIATKDFLESLKYRAQNLGRLSGCEFAEGFTVEKLLAIKNFEGIIL